MAYSAGQASLQIVPSFKGVADAIDAEAQKWGDSAGTTFGDAFAAAASGGTKDAVGSSDGDAADKGSAAGGAFADAFRARVDAALAALPAVDIKGNPSEIDAEIAEIRAELEELSSKRIGIDIEEDDALARLAVLKAALDDIGSQSESIRVKVDTAAATAELSAFDAEVAASTAETDALGAGASGASGGIGDLAANAGSGAAPVGALAAAIGVLAVALIPIAGLAAGALSTLPALLAGAGAGLGALKLGLGPISTALSDYSTQQSAAAKATAGGAATANTAASQAVSNAQTIRNAANSVAQAEEALANAQQQAANSVHSANEQLVASENQLADAEYNEQQAQQAVIDARTAAQQQLTSYTDQLADSSLAIQQAQLDIQTAQSNLTASGPGSGSTPEQQAQAQLTYQQAVQRLQDLQDQNSALQTSASQAAAAGVDGNQAVVSAVHQLGDAQNAVQTAQQSNTDAQTALAQAQVAAVQKVADANTALTNALLNQSDALQQIALAAGGTGGSGGAAGATNAFAAAMAALSPAGRDFVNFIIGVKKEVSGLSQLVQGALLPGLQAGLSSALTGLFGPLSGFILQAASGIGSFVQQLGAFVGSKAGVADITGIFQSGASFMGLMSKAALELIPAILTIGKQASPITAALGKGILDLVTSFSKWVSGGGFEKFVQWLATNGPGIVSDLSGFLKGVGNLIVALAPAGKVFLDLAGGIGNFVSSISGAISFVAGELTRPLHDFTTLLGGVTKGIDYLSSHWRQLWADIKQWADDGYQHVKSAVFDPLSNFFTQTIPQIFDDTVSWFQALPGRISSALGDFVSTIFGALENVGSWLETNVWGPLSGWFVAIPGRVASDLGDFYTAGWTALTKAATWLEANVASPVLSWFEGLPKRVATGVGDFLGTALSDLATVGSWLESNVWTPVYNFFAGPNGLGSRIAGIAKGMWDGVANAFIDAINALINVWDGLHFTVGGGSFLGITVPSFTLTTPHINDLSPVSTKAAGGSVAGGTLYQVNEMGIEYFMPNSGGYIVPSNQLTTPNSLSAPTSNSGPAVAIGEFHAHDEASIEGMMRQASFIRKQRRL